jgi:hypothetical protein
VIGDRKVWDGNAGTTHRVARWYVHLCTKNPTYGGYFGGPGLGMESNLVYFNAI